MSEVITGLPMSSCWLIVEDATPLVESVMLSLVGSPAVLYPIMSEDVPGRLRPAGWPARLYSFLSCEPLANCL